MSTTAGVSLDDYLSTHYEPECELIDGELVTKAFGTVDHSDVQTVLAVILTRYKVGGIVKVGISVSIRHGGNVLIPDISVYRRGSRLYRGILDEPPILCIEILSLGEKHSDLFLKFETLHSWGVPFCWVIDPVERAAWEYRAGGAAERVVDCLHAGEMTVTLAEIFEEV